MVLFRNEDNPILPSFYLFQHGNRGLGIDVSEVADMVEFKFVNGLKMLECMYILYRPRY